MCGILLHIFVEILADIIKGLQNHLVHSVEAFVANTIGPGNPLLLYGRIQELLQYSFSLFRYDVNQFCYLNHDQFSFSNFVVKPFSQYNVF